MSSDHITYCSMYYNYVYRGMEEIARYCPQHINFKKDNGSTPLHVAVANSHCDIVSLLACHVSHCHLTWWSYSRLDLAAKKKTVRWKLLVSTIDICYTLPEEDPLGLKHWSKIVNNSTNRFLTMVIARILFTSVQACRLPVDQYIL